MKIEDSIKMYNRISNQLANSHIYRIYETICFSSPDIDVTLNSLHRSPEDMTYIRELAERGHGKIEFDTDFGSSISKADMRKMLKKELGRALKGCIK